MIPASLDVRTWSTPARIGIPAFATALLLSLAAHGTNVLPGDLRLATWTQSHNGWLIECAAAYGNWIGQTIPVGVVALLAAGCLVAVRRRAEALLVIATFAAKVFNPLIKELVQSPRPSPNLVRVTETHTSYGFPSGHVMGVTLVFGGLTFLALRSRPTRPGRFTILAVAVPTFVSTVTGRIYAGAHWPSDTLSGALWGAAMLCALIRLVGSPSPARSAGEQMSSRHKGPSPDTRERG